MKFRLLDWHSDPTVVEIGDLNDIARMMIDVISGDEVLTVIYKDYSIGTFDSSHSRREDCHDDYYEIYHFNKSENRMNDPKFVNRTNSYWLWYEDEDDLD